MRSVQHCRLAGSAFAAMLLCSAPAWAEPLAMTEPARFPASIFEQIVPDAATPRQPNDESAGEPSSAAVPAHLRRQVVAYDTREPPGTIVIDTPHTYLYFVLGGGRAIRYGIGVGRDGFTWSGVQSIARKQEWPDWYPPEEMIARQPYLPRFMAGGPGNPLGARAMYLGNTMYRIHGTNDPNTIGKHVSSGCIRLTNEDVIDLFNRASVGAKVVVLTDGHYRAAAATQAAPVRAARTRISQATPPAPEPPRPVASVSERTRALYFGSSLSRLY